MSEPDVRKRIVDAINSIPNTGEVYNYIPWSDSADVHLNFFKTKVHGHTETMRGFTVSLTGIAPAGEVSEHDGFDDDGVALAANEIPAAEIQAGVEIYTYTIQGFQSVGNNGRDTENDFLQTVIAVMGQLDTANLSNFGNRPRAQLSYGPDLVGGTLCHVAEITLEGIKERTAC